MRAVRIKADDEARSPFRWTTSRVLIVSAVYAAPLLLLMIKLHAEAADGTVPGGANSVLIRSVLVGVLSCLMTRWCIAWMKRWP